MSGVCVWVVSGQLHDSLIMYHSSLAIHPDTLLVLG